MKDRYINSVCFMLIDRQGYSPVKGSYGELAIREDIKVLQKFSYGACYYVDLIDGDFLDAQDIVNRLEANQRWLQSLEERTPVYFIEVFIFNSAPGDDKRQAMIYGQLKDDYMRKYLVCFAVNLNDRGLWKYFNAKLPTDAIEKVIEKNLENNTYGDKSISDLLEYINESEKSSQIELKAKTPYITYALLFTNIAVWVLINAYALWGLYNVNSLLVIFGAKVNELIRSEHEYWRFITPIFLHAGMLHLFFNSYSLYAVGPTVEKIYGNHKFVFIYFLAGIMGNIASFALTPYPNIPGVGASGAIFGLLGAIVYYGVENPRTFKRYFGYNVIVIIIINLAFGFSTEGIDNFAHIGGLIGGFLAAGILGVKDFKRGMAGKRLLAIIITVFLAGTGLYYGFIR